MTFEGVGKKEWSVKGQGQWDFVDAIVLGTCLEKERRETSGSAFLYVRQSPLSISVISAMNHGVNP